NRPGSRGAFPSCGASWKPAFELGRPASPVQACQEQRQAKRAFRMGRRTRDAAAAAARLFLDLAIVLELLVVHPLQVHLLGVLAVIPTVAIFVPIRGALALFLLFLVLLLF